MAYGCSALIDQVASIATSLEVSHAIVAMPGATAATRRRAMELAAAAGLTVLTVPAFSDLLSGKFAISQVRAVELEDLLGRDRIELDEAGLHRLLEDKTVLVTGAGGSIGSELCRQIVRFGPRKLVFLEQSEFALYSIEQEFAGQPVSCVIGDVKDAARMAAVFAEHRPDVVFPCRRLQACAADGARQRLGGGAQQRAGHAERRARGACQRRRRVRADFHRQGGQSDQCHGRQQAPGGEWSARQCRRKRSATRFVMVRFGNVLGSSGSVIPRFREQIARGGPVTVTHPDIIRYFMLIPEAAQLVLQAGLMAAREAEGGGCSCSTWASR